jgi:hypothetical protein
MVFVDSRKDDCVSLNNENGAETLFTGKKAVEIKCITHHV